MGSSSSRDVHYPDGGREREREQGHHGHGQGWRRAERDADPHAHAHRPYYRSSENPHGQDRARSSRTRTGRPSSYGERYLPSATPSGRGAAGSVKPVLVDAELTAIEVGRGQQLVQLHTANDGSGSSVSSSVLPAMPATGGGSVADAGTASNGVVSQPFVSTQDGSGSGSSSSSSSSSTDSETPLAGRRLLVGDDLESAGRGQIELAAASGGAVGFEGYVSAAATGGARQAYDEEGLRAACETNFHRHRVNEMQERLRRYAGLPPSLDIQELERRGILSAESHLGVQRRRMEIMSGGLDDVGQNVGASTNSDAFDLTAWSSPSFRAWDGSSGPWPQAHQERPLYSEGWEGNITIRRPGSQGNETSSPQVGSSGQASPPHVESAGSSRTDSGGRESRRNGGRRLWDALTRAASHRRTTTSLPPVVIPEEVEEFGSSTDRWTALRDWRSGPEEERFGDGGIVQSGRSLDLEERRRRVRSQVWALQRLSNGLEGVPGHGTPCSRGGYHHGSRCSCESHSSSDDTNTRASISRIIMLAEALFEVLDEIHRQSVALSRSATVSLASLPAPDTVVDAIPIRIHKKPESTKNICEDVAQCYICLVEYEEGDHVRVLPCQHEYHMACVDKWLKEIHRVCPLCRGNVCKSAEVTAARPQSPRLCIFPSAVISATLYAKTTANVVVGRKCGKEHVLGS